MEVMEMMEMMEMVIRPSNRIEGYRLMRCKCRPTWLFLIAWMLVAPSCPPAHAADPFPQYGVIAPNVAFWKDIYSRYASTRAVVHDSLHLDIVYAVINLKPADVPGARKYNRKIMKAAAKKHADILERLAADPRSQDEACRRVAKRFGPDADAAVFRRASRRVRCQVGQRDRFRAGLIRSGAYIDQMRAILESRGVPADLAYLPHVESSFNLKAYSKFGAAGMWQFTRSTGKRFMTVDYVVDERRDPIAATRAAARLLKRNYDRLGTWPLAITAYNHGAAGMVRAQAAHGDYPEIFTAYNGRTFKFASRNFYSEFLAARQVAADYEHYFGPLALKSPLKSLSVRLDGYADFKELCRHFEVAPEIARAMNPALRPPVFNGQKYVPKGYAFNLPAGKGPESRILAQAPPDFFKKAQKPSRFYTVQRGDTAGKIARMHRVPLRDLILANHLDRRATIYPRQTLHIPRAGASIPAPKKTLPEKPANIAAPTLAAAKPVGVVPVCTADLYYRRPGPSPAELLALPGIGPSNGTEPPSDGIEVGIQPEMYSTHVKFERVIQFDGRPVGILEAEVEETLGHYAEWAGIRASHIRRLNGFPYGRTMRLHQEVKIPLAHVAAAEFESRRYEFHKKLREDFFAVYRVGELRRYRVRPGDSYWSLCREKFELPLWLFQQYNADVDLAALKIGQSLVVPYLESLSRDNPPAAEQVVFADD
jgi:membrane-bound lytic murein transglycosylase D